MEFDIKMSRFSVKSRFKESKCTDGGHSLNRDLTVVNILLPSIVQAAQIECLGFQADFHQQIGIARLWWDKHPGISLEDPLNGQVPIG